MLNTYKIFNKFINIIIYLDRFINNMDNKHKLMSYLT